MNAPIRRDADNSPAPHRTPVLFVAVADPVGHPQLIISMDRVERPEPLPVLNHIEYGDSCIESGVVHMPGKTKPGAVDWKAKVKGMLKAELKRRELTYVNLAEKLAEIGIKESERNISNKIVRGTFSAMFFVQCLEAVGCKTIHLGDQ